MKKALFILFCSAVSALAWNPSNDSFDTNLFNTLNFRVTLKPGSLNSNLFDSATSAALFTQSTSNYWRNWTIAQFQPLSLNLNDWSHIPTNVLLNLGTSSNAVDSVNGKTGDVNLTTSDITEGSNLYWTLARSNALYNFAVQFAYGIGLNSTNETARAINAAYSNIASSNFTSRSEIAGSNFVNRTELAGSNFTTLAEIAGLNFITNSQADVTLSNLSALGQLLAQLIQPADDESNGVPVILRGGTLIEGNDLESGFPPGAAIVQGGANEQNGNGANAYLLGGNHEDPGSNGTEGSGGDVVISGGTNYFGQVDGRVTLQPYGGPPVYGSAANMSNAPITLGYSLVTQSNGATAAWMLGMDASGKVTTNSVPSGGGGGGGGNFSTNASGDAEIIGSVVTTNIHGKALTISSDPDGEDDTPITINAGAGLQVNGQLFVSDAMNGSGSGITDLNADELTSGTVPTARLGSGTANSLTFLRGDNTWQTISGSGTVTSVGLSMPAGFSVSGSPVTGSGTLSVSFSAQFVSNNNTFAQTFSNKVAIDAAHAFFPSNTTPSRIAMIGPDGSVTNASATSAASPLNRDGTATTAAQVVGLFTGTPNGAQYLKDDGTLGTPAGGSGFWNTNAADGSVSNNNNGLGVTIVGPLKFNVGITNTAGPYLGIDGLSYNGNAFTNLNAANYVTQNPLTNAVTNQVFTFTTFASASNAIALNNNFQLFNASGNCAVTNVTGQVATEARWATLVVSNSTASAVTLSIYPPGARVIGAGSTNALSIASGKVGIASFMCVGTAITNYCTGAQQ